MKRKKKIKNIEIDPSENNRQYTEDEFANAYNYPRTKNMMLKIDESKIETT